MRRLASKAAELSGCPHTNWAGGDHRLHRPVASRNRQRTRYVLPTRTTWEGMVTSLLKAVISSLSHVGVISYFAGSLSEDTGTFVGVISAIRHFMAANGFPPL